MGWRVLGRHGGAGLGEEGGPWPSLVWPPSATPSGPATGQSVQSHELSEPRSSSASLGVNPAPEASRGCSSITTVVGIMSVHTWPPRQASAVTQEAPGSSLPRTPSRRCTHRTLEPRLLLQPLLALMQLQLGWLRATCRVHSHLCEAQRRVRRSACSLGRLREGPPGVQTSKTLSSHCTWEAKGRQMPLQLVSGICPHSVGSLWTALWLAGDRKGSPWCWRHCPMWVLGPKIKTHTSGKVNKKTPQAQGTKASVWWFFPAAVVRQCFIPKTPQEDWDSSLNSHQLPIY